MRIIKRNGSETAFDISKIIAAITRANDTVDESLRLTPTQIREIADNVVAPARSWAARPTSEEVQDMVEKQIMAHEAYDVAKNYITYRYTRALVGSPIPPIIKYLALSNAITKRPNRRTQTKTRWSIPPSATTWRARCRAI